MEKLAVLIKLSDRDYLSLILGLIDVTLEGDVSGGSDCLEDAAVRREALCKVVGACASIRSMYCGSYPCDRDLICALESFKSCFARCIRTGRFDSELEALRAALIKNIDVYCTTEWQRIKKETIGKKRSSSDAWAKTFKQIEGMYEVNMEGVSVVSSKSSQ